MTVVLATEGYPLAPRSGDVIDGLDPAAAIAGAHVYYAGVARRGDGSLVTAGGRVLNVTGVGLDLEAARVRAYAAVSEISWRGMVFRSDVAADLTR